MPQITNQLEWLLQIFDKDYSRAVPPNVTKIKLSQLVSKLGFFYEKFRNAIDYNEEHLIRRNSLKRLLNRQILFLQENDATKISQTLIYEFIRANYLPNDALPESLIDDLGILLNKYLSILKAIAKTPLAYNNKIDAWLMDLAACEIDEYLFPREKDLAMVNFMYSETVANMTFAKLQIDEKEKNLQIYLAVLRTLLQADPPLLRYRLLNLYYPAWTKMTDEEAAVFAGAIEKIKAKIDKHLAHALGYQITQTLKVQAVFYGILKQLIGDNSASGREIIADQTALEIKISEICLKNYKAIHSRLLGSIFRVIIYIFFTKTILAFILELPYDRFFIGQVNWRALAINVVFHPLLMSAIATTIKVPGEKNTKIIVNEIKKIVYGEKRQIVFKPRKLMRRGSASYFIFNAFYLVMFLISFGIVIFALRQFHFNIVSGVLFIFFLTVVSFFGFRLRNFANQYLVIPRQDNLLNFLIDFFTLPIIRVGRFLSTNFARINIFLYLLDFIIETPFKMLVEILEKAVSFIKEKREEISE